MLTATRKRFDSGIFCETEDDTSNLRVNQWGSTLINNADPCAHCGAKLFAKESKGCAAKTGSSSPAPATATAWDVISSPNFNVHNALAPPPYGGEAPPSF